MSKILFSGNIPEAYPKNIASMLYQNAESFPDHLVYCEKDASGNYQGITWRLLLKDVETIAFNLRKAGLTNADKVILFSPNSLFMLKAELAIMASGLIAVPIFAYFKKNTATLLIDHSDAAYCIVDGTVQFKELGDELKLKTVWCFQSVDLTSFCDLRPFDELLKPIDETGFSLSTAAQPDDICLNMYTSGTMGVPKGVQLTHGNILSQQAAIRSILKVDQKDRFLSYLPWHHSFGGIFELFCALYNGATYFLESSFGKNPAELFDNWKRVKPSVFFSVPKVYQALLEKTKENKEDEDAFFHGGLKFIFTAAAALPQRLSDAFEKRNIPVIEGWGLTETSPCCTLTNPAIKRQSGVVGFPIPGVTIRIADDDEIQVKGPNVMVSYYKNDAANDGTFTDDGWYRTGDVGEITAYGLKLIARKDRIFKLSNGEKVIPTDLEKAIELKCHYVQYALVTGNGEDYPVALLFPNKKLLHHPDYALTPDEGCFCPRSINELGRCLTHCLQVANESIGQKFAKIRAAAIIPQDLSLDDNTLTPSMKVAPRNVIEKYRSHLLTLYGEAVPLEEEVFIVELDSQRKVH